MLVRRPKKKSWLSGGAIHVSLPGFSPSSLSPAAWWEAATSTMYKSNAGSGAAPTANGDVIGYVTDLSGNGFDLTSVADDSTRPTLNGVGVHPYFTFDAATQYLKRGAALDLYNAAGGFSMFFAVKAHGNYLSRSLYSEGKNASNPLLSYLQNDGTTSTTGTCFWRDNSGTIIVNLATDFAITNAYPSPATDTVVGMTYDGSTSILGYVNQSQVGSFTLTRGTISGLTQTALGVLWRTSTTGYFGDRIYAGVIVKGSVLSSGNRTSLITYLGNLAGLTI